MNTVDFSTTIIRYTTLTDLISKLPEAYSLDPYCLRQRQLVDNLDGILKESGAKSAVIEEYIDRHFIHDFCGHYGSCYHDYPKKCLRLHFFGNEFDEDEFKRIITQQEAEDATIKLGVYAGYITLRPLPTAIFGNVALRISQDAQNIFVIKKTIKTHLCGLELWVETIPFQEQDKAISACATSAIWIALHAVPGNQSHNVLSPYRLTQKAKTVLVEGVKSHEITRGLTISQMAWAIKDDNIVPLVSAPPSTSYLKAVIRAYLYAKIPMVLGIKLYYSNDSQSKSISNKVIGYHAVTVLGYAEQNSGIKPFDAPDMGMGENVEALDLFLESSSIATLFCHDDQIGPFSQMSFPDEYSPALTTEWGKGDCYGPVDAKVLSILIPCSPKVRIRFSKIYDVVKNLNLFFAENYRDWYNYGVSWDIRLETVCQLKSRIRSLRDEELNPGIKYEILTTSMPRYVWVVDQILNWSEEDKLEKIVVATFLFDATDIENSNFLMKVIHFNVNAYKVNKASFILDNTFISKNNHLSIIRNIRDAYMRDDRDVIIIV